MSRALRVVGCFKRQNLEITYGPMEMCQTNNCRTVSRNEFMARYREAAEEIDSILPPPKHEHLPLAAYYNSDLAHGRVTIRSMGGVVGMVGKTAIMHKPKKQTNVETSTYGPKLNYRKIGIECCHKSRCMLRILGVEVNSPTKYYGDIKYTHESCANENAE